MSAAFWSLQSIFSWLPVLSRLGRDNRLVRGAELVGRGWEERGPQSQEESLLWVALARAPCCPALLLVWSGWMEPRNKSLSVPVLSLLGRCWGLGWEVANPLSVDCGDSGALSRTPQRKDHTQKPLCAPESTPSQAGMPANLQWLQVPMELLPQFSGTSSMVTLCGLWCGCCRDMAAGSHGFQHPGAFRAAWDQ